MPKILEKIRDENYQNCENDRRDLYSLQNARSLIHQNECNTHRFLSQYETRPVVCSSGTLGGIFSFPLRSPARDLLMVCKFQGKKREMRNERVSTTPSAAMSIDICPVFSMWEAKKRSSGVANRAVLIPLISESGVRITFWTEELEAIPGRSRHHFWSLYLCWSRQCYWSRLQCWNRLL